MAMYQQKCTRCRKNWVTISGRSRGYPVCYECEKNELKGEIKDPKMKRMFNIPHKFYKQSSFLRDIKINYLRFGRLSERQIEAFKKAVARLKEDGQKNKKTA
jgi:hypothetical protein